MTVIRHSPNTTLQTHTERSTTFLVKLHTPFVSSIKRIDRMFVKSKSDLIAVKGMGRAIEKTLGIGALYEGRLGYGVEYYTGSVEVLDEIVDEEDEEEESMYRKRMVSFVELKIRKERQ